jgi:hypothetical protein
MVQEATVVEPHGNELILEMRDIFSHMCIRHTDSYTMLYLKGSL